MTTIESTVEEHPQCACGCCGPAAGIVDTKCQCSCGCAGGDGCTCGCCDAGCDCGCSLPAA